MNKLRSASYPTVAPSLLAMDKTKIASEVDLIRKSGLVFAHIDIMDGKFVENTSFTIEETKEIIKNSQNLIKDVHIMVEKPWEVAKTYADLGADSITFHYEACTHIHRAVQQIKSLGVKAGVVLNPHTPVSVLEDILADLDVVLLMSVNPGFGGQKLIPYCVDKMDFATRSQI